MGPFSVLDILYRPQRPQRVYKGERGCAGLSSQSINMQQYSNFHLMPAFK